MYLPLTDQEADSISRTTTTTHGQTGMYGPPLCRKRKMRVTGWSVGRLVCADVYALGWSTELLALMECAEPSSYLGTQSRKTFPVCRFRERRVRPLSHLMVRQQTWQKHQLVIAAGL